MTSLNNWSGWLIVVNLNNFIDLQFIVRRFLEISDNSTKTVHLYQLKHQDDIKWCHSYVFLNNFQQENWKHKELFKYSLLEYHVTIAVLYN